MRAVAPGEGRSDAAMFEIELGVADLGLCVVDSGLRTSFLGRALINGLFGAEGFRCEDLGAIEFTIGEREPGACRFQERVGLGQLDLVGARVDGAFVHDVAIFEVDSGQRAADLCAQLDLLDRGKLTKEAEPKSRHAGLSIHRW